MKGCSKLSAVVCCTILLGLVCQGGVLAVDTCSLYVYLNEPDNSAFKGAKVTCHLISTADTLCYDDTTLVIKKPLWTYTDSDGRFSVHMIPSVNLDSNSYYEFSVDYGKTIQKFKVEIPDSAGQTLIQLLRNFRK